MIRQVSHSVRSGRQFTDDAAVVEAFTDAEAFAVPRSILCRTGAGRSLMRFDNFPASYLKKTIPMLM